MGGGATRTTLQGRKIMFSSGPGGGSSRTASPSFNLAARTRSYRRLPCRRKVLLVEVREVAGVEVAGVVEEAEVEETGPEGATADTGSTSSTCT